MDLQVKVAKHLFESANGDADLRRYQEAMEGLRKIVDIIGNRFFTQSMVILCQALVSVLRLRRETDTWSMDRAMALMPLEHEISQFYGFRPIASLLADPRFGALQYQIGVLNDVINDNQHIEGDEDCHDWFINCLETTQDVSSVVQLGRYGRS